MTRDEFCAAVLAAGWITVDAIAGKAFRHRGNGGVKLTTPKELTGSECNGYRVVTLHLGNQRRQVRMHRLVWIAANGIPTSGMVIAHLNNDKTDNRIVNLAVMTAEQNSTEAQRDGLYRTPTPKVSYQVILDDYKQGQSTIRELATKYGLSKSRIHQIVREIHWTCVASAKKGRTRPGIEDSETQSPSLASNGSSNESRRNDE